jgi:molybdate transport system ATP-binding protein
VSVLTFEARHRYTGGFLFDVRFETSARVTALFGPSGSGKSSAVEMIAGLRKPERGYISVGGELLYDSATALDLAPEARGIGVVFQDLLLFPHKNVEKNLRYGVRRGRTAGPEVQFERVVDVLELNALLERPIRALSGGERQRVALGRALLSRPRLLLMDEPLTALDERLKLRVLAYIERIVEQWAVPVVFVSHAQAEVRRLAERVVVMDGGRVVAAGPPEEALAVPGAMALKNASGPMNLLRVTQLREEAGRWTGEVGDQRIVLPALETPPRGDVYVQVAPESVLLSREDLAGVSARNHLRGTVRDIVSVGGASFVAVDAGQIVWAEVTPAAVSELGLKRGAPVFCLIKTHSLRLLE